MLVNLSRAWFGPDGTRRKRVDNPHEVPDDWTLPSGAKVVEEPKGPVPKPEEPKPAKTKESVKL